MYTYVESFHAHLILKYFIYKNIFSSLPLYNTIIYTNDFRRDESYVRAYDVAIVYPDFRRQNPSDSNKT